MGKLFFLTCAIGISFISSHAQFVGIGSTTPFGKLQINHKGVANNPSLVLFDSTTGTGSEIRFVKQGFSTAFNFNMNTVLTGVASTSFWKLNASSNPSMTINGNGHIYFGANTPAYVSRFNFDGSVNFTDNLTMNGDAGQIGQPLVSNSENFGAPAWYPNAYFLANGKMGLGTDVPASKLQINHTNTGSSPSLTLFDSTSGSGSALVFSKQGFAANLSIWSGIFGNSSSGNSLNFQHSGGSPVMTIMGDGKVGINEESPANALDVGGNLNFSGKLKLSGNTGLQNQVLISNGNSSNPTWQNINAVTGNSVGFGPWGDCSTNAISEYNPVVDTTGAASDLFGNSVSISGNYAIVGAPQDDVGVNTDQGSASIFQWNGTNWVLMQKITDATGSANDEFGSSVSISGNYAIVGSPTDDIGANADQGSASIYQLSGGIWVLMNKITDATGATADLFGEAVSISGNYVIVGAFLDDVGANGEQGSASIFQWNGTNWVLMNKITDATGAASDQFGNSVSISGNYAIVGSHFDNVGANGAQGSASIYQWNGSNWVLMNKITDPVGGVNDEFGESVSISGNYAIAGAWLDDVGANANQGSVSIYQWNGSNWVLMNKITDAVGGVNDEFGNSVSISGNYAIVGAYQDDVGANSDQGSATIYQRVGLGWVKLQYVTDPAGNSNNAFSNSAAFDGSSKRFLISSSNYAGNSGKAIFGKVN